MRNRLFVLLAFPLSAALVNCVSDSSDDVADGNDAAPGADGAVGGDGAVGADGQGPGNDSSMNDDGAITDSGSDTGNDSGPQPTVGKLDPSFANGPSANAGALAIDGQSRVYLASTSSNCVRANSLSDFIVTRLDASGNLDTSFGTGGSRCVDFDTNDSDTPVAIAIDPSGNVLVGGYSLSATTPYYFGASVAKLDSTGTILWQYRYENADSALTEVRAFAFAGARVYAVGTNGVSNNQRTASFVAALQTTTGALDTGWNSTGIETDTIAFSNFGATVAGGKLLVVGGNPPTTGRQFLTRQFTTGGLPDNTFGLSGADLTEVSTGTQFDTAYAVAVQSDSKVLVAGGSGAGNKLGGGTKANVSVLRYVANGTGLDTTGFAAAGTAPGIFVSPLIWNTANDAQSSGMILEPSGKIILGGIGTALPDGGPADITLMRLDPNGTVDTTFGDNGAAHSNYATDTSIGQMARDPATGRIVVIGSAVSSAVMYRFL